MYMVAMLLFRYTMHPITHKFRTQMSKILRVKASTYNYVGGGAPGVHVKVQGMAKPEQLCYSISLI